MNTLTIRSLDDLIKLCQWCKLQADGKEQVQAFAGGQWHDCQLFGWPPIESVARFRYRLKTRPVAKGELEKSEASPSLSNCSQSLLEARIESALDHIYGPRESYRPLLAPTNILQRICRNAGGAAVRRGTEPRVVISDITGHGSGVSAAIYRVYGGTTSEQEIDGE